MRTTDPNEELEPQAEPNTTTAEDGTVAEGPATSEDKAEDEAEPRI